LISGGFQAPTGVEPHTGKRKKFKPPLGQIPEYAPGAAYFKKKHTNEFAEF